MKRILITVASVVVASVVLVAGGGCGTKTAAKPHPPVNLEMMAPPSSTGPYAEALAEGNALNKNHAWLKGSVVETKGLEEAIAVAADYPADRKKLAIMGSGFQHAMVQAINGLPPFKKKYPDLKYIASYGAGQATIITYDPNINSPKDLIGKKVGLFNIGSSALPLGEAILRAWGILDQVKVQNMPPSQFKDALKTGQVSAVHVTFTSPAPGKFIAASYIQEIAAGGKWHTIPITADDVAKMKKDTAFSGSKSTTIPANTLGQGFPPEDIKAVQDLNVLNAWEAADSDVIYEFLKAMNDLGAEVEKGMPGFKPNVNVTAELAKGAIPKEMIHAGALKFYQDNKLEFWK
ncbi:MAG: ABC transporter substrate-binding protein [Chloroflexi bacterium]|nr:ABC transporter substrate-binding protein [Chloroflexota bacterium]